MIIDKIIVCINFCRLVQSLSFLLIIAINWRQYVKWPSQKKEKVCPSKQRQVEQIGHTIEVKIRLKREDLKQSPGKIKIRLYIPRDHQPSAGSATSWQQLYNKT